MEAWLPDCERPDAACQDFQHSADTQLASPAVQALLKIQRGEDVCLGPDFETQQGVGDMATAVRSSSPSISLVRRGNPHYHHHYNSSNGGREPNELQCRAAPAGYAAVAPSRFLLLQGRTISIAFCIRIRFRHNEHLQYEISDARTLSKKITLRLRCSRPQRTRSSLFGWICSTKMPLAGEVALTMSLHPPSYRGKLCQSVLRS